MYEQHMYLYWYQKSANNFIEKCVSSSGFNAIYMYMIQMRHILQTRFVVLALHCGSRGVELADVHSKIGRPTALALQFATLYEFARFLNI